MVNGADKGALASLPSSTCSRDNNGSGAGADNDASASSVVPPLLTHAMMVVAVVWMTVPQHCQRTVTCSRNNNNNNGGVPWHCRPSLLACLTTALAAVRVQTTVPWHHLPFSTCSRNDDGGVGSADNGAFASSVAPLLLAHAMMAAAVVQMMVPLHCWQSVACLHNNDNDDSGDGMDDSGNGVDDSFLASSAIPACSLNNENSSGGGAEDGASASLAVPCLLKQRQWRWQRRG